MNDTYYSERRAVSREMRRAAARRKMSIAAAVGCILVAVAIAVVTVIDVADANEADHTENASTYEERIQTFAPYGKATEALHDGFPLIGEVTTLPKKAHKPEQKYTEEELEMLALVIYQEAGGDACSDSTRRMVGEVVLNRVDHPFYPNNLEDVLTQYGQYGMLYWTGLVWPQRAKYEVEQSAVNRAYRIAKEVLTSDYRLLPGDVLFQAEFPQGTEIVVEQDGLYFCR